MLCKGRSKISAGLFFDIVPAKRQMQGSDAVGGNVHVAVPGNTRSTSGPSFKNPPG
jgi:hypothetical protein